MKRFWKDVSVEKGEGGYHVFLDGRQLKTPARQTLMLPEKRLAELVADEWRMSGEQVDPAAMPMTGFANAAIDRVGPERQAFVDAIAAYGESEFFCYRAESPGALVGRQDECWGKWLGLAKARFDVDFEIIYGITHRPQPPETLVRLRAQVAALSDFQLAAASRLVHLSGSLAATLLLADAAAEPGELWQDLILDELWQEEQWGSDEYAIRNRNDRKDDFLKAARFLAYANNPPR